MRPTYATALAAALVAGPGMAATVVLDFSGTVGANNIGLVNDDTTYEATAVFDTDSPVTGVAASNERTFADALSSFEITIGGDTVDSNRPGDATQSGSGSPTSSTDVGFVLGGGDDALDGTVNGREAQSLALEFSSSFADGANYFTDVDQLLNRVVAEGAVPLGPNTGLFQSVRFAPEAPGGASGFVVLTLDDDPASGFTVQADPLAPIPLPASGLLLAGGLTLLGLRRRRG